MYTTRCDNGCVINNKTTPFWSIPLSLRDKNTASVNVVGDRKSSYRHVILTKGKLLQDASNMSPNKMEHNREKLQEVIITIPKGLPFLT